MELLRSRSNTYPWVHHRLHLGAEPLSRHHGEERGESPRERSHSDQEIVERHSFLLHSNHAIPSV